MSSPVLAMMVISSGGITAASPTRNFEAPTPPASAVTLNGGWRLGVGGRLLFSSVPFCALSFGKLFIRFLAGAPSPDTGPRLQAYDSISCGLDLVSAVDADSEHGHSLEGARAVKGSRIDGSQAADERDRFHHSGLRFFRVAGHKRVAIKRLIDFGEQVSRLGLES